MSNGYQLPSGQFSSLNCNNLQVDGSATSTIYTVDVKLLPSQLLSLTPTTPIQLLPPPGAGYLWQTVPIGSFGVQPGATPYSVVGNVGITIGPRINSHNVAPGIDNALSQATPYFEQASAFAFLQYSGASQAATWVNQPIILGIDAGGSISGGDGTLFIRASFLKVAAPF